MDDNENVHAITEKVVNNPQFTNMQFLQAGVLPFRYGMSDRGITLQGFDRSEYTHHLKPGVMRGMQGNSVRDGVQVL